MNTGPDDSLSLSCIHELIERQAHRTPQAIALISGGLTVTYEELCARANQVAHHLCRRGAGAEAYIGVCLERSIDAAIALLGILKSGAAYVYLDPTHPDKRLQQLVQDCNPKWIVTDASHQGRFPDPSICITMAETGNEEVSALHPNVDPDNAACLLYTSGSTAIPKGVVEIHRSLTARLTCGPLPDMEAGDICCLNSSLGFGITASRLFLPLALGARLVIFSEEEVSDIQCFVRGIERHRVSSAFISPVLLRSILGLDAGLLRCLRVLRVVTATGSALTPELIRSFFAALPNTKLVNVYGSAEIGTTAALQVLDGGEVPAEISIGCATANSRIQILDENLVEVTAGEAGEICVSAPHLARGYLNQPDLTAQKFIADPVRPSQRLYRTGDLGRVLPNGEIQFLGRRDHQVKIRGVRIELGEVEAVLEQHDGVQESAVKVQDSGGEKRLIAYFVTANGVRPTATALRAFMAGRLPGHMVPSGFMRLDEMPRTSTGKLDRNALPDFNPGRPDIEIAYAAPGDEIEEKLCGIWRGVLGLDLIGVDDNYFDLGGDSVLSIRLFSEVNREFGLDLPASTLFRAATVRSVATVIRSSHVQEVCSAVVPIQTQGSKRPIFCIAGYDGEVVMFRKLATHLGQEQPVYGLQPFGLGSRNPVLMHIEAISENYIEEIKQAGWKAPFCLVGYSFGGLVAIEMARRLSAAGERMSCVILIDTPNPVTYATRTWTRRYRYRLGLDRLKERVKRGYFRTAFRFGIDLKRTLSMSDLQLLAMQAYRVKRYSGRVHLFRTNGSRIPSRTLGWDGLLLDLVVHEVPGDHHTVLTGDNFRTLADEVSRCLP